MIRSTKRDRILNAIAGHGSDRVPASFWYHFPLEHPSGESLAEAELAFAKKYDPDFLKVMHDLPLDLPDGMEKIEDPADWSRFKPLDPRKGNFTEQIKALKIIKQNLHVDMPIIDTIFNPFAAANKLCSGKITDHYRANPDGVKRALQAIAVSLADYSTAWIEEGGDGIYYALDGAQYTTMSEEEYKSVYLSLDKLILETAMEKGTLNILHLHGTDLMFDLTHTLPTHVLQWSSRITPPVLGEGRAMHQGCIGGGIDEMSILQKSPDEVIREARQAIAEAGSGCFILTPGCAIPTDTPEENIFAMRQAVEM